MVAASGRFVGHSHHSCNIVSGVDDCAEAFYGKFGCAEEYYFQVFTGHIQVFTGHIQMFWV